MSYSFSFPITRGEHPTEAVHNAWAGPRSHQVEQGTGDEAGRAVEAVAADALPALLDALGPNWSTASVSISGHANPGNVPTSGWANDCIAVRIDVTTYRAE